VAKAKREGETAVSGLRKAAILLLSLGRDTAAKVIRHLDREAIQEVTREIASLEQVDAHLRQQVLEEFYHLVLATQFAHEGGLESARVLLEKSLPKEEALRIIQQIEHQVHQQPFSFLQKTEAESLLAFIQEEHPQTIALILAHLPSTKAAEILSGLPAAKQVEGRSPVGQPGVRRP